MFGGWLFVLSRCVVGISQPRIRDTSDREFLIMTLSVCQGWVIVMGDGAEYICSLKIYSLNFWVLKTTKISPFISSNPCVLSGFFLFSQFSSQKRLLTAIARKASRSGKWRRKKMLDVNMFVTTPMRRVLLINSAPPSKKKRGPPFPETKWMWKKLYVQVMRTLIVCRMNRSFRWRLNQKRNAKAN